MLVKHTDVLAQLTHVTRVLHKPFRGRGTSVQNWPICTENDQVYHYTVVMHIDNDTYVFHYKERLAAKAHTPILFLCSVFW